MANDERTRGLVLGLDLGQSSVGWALLEAEFDQQNRQVEEKRIVAVGVRVFPEGVNQARGREEPRNVARRAARSARRVHQRRMKRKRDLVRILREAGLLPREDEALQALMALDPYELRAQALDRRLEPHELGRALYHLNQRRGFKSNRKQERDKEDSKTVLEMKALEQEVNESGARTLGEYLHRMAEANRTELLHGELRLRNRRTLRSMYEQEFDAIWQAQRLHHPDRLSQDLKERLAREVIFFQRPFELTRERVENLPPRANARRAPSVAPCPLEPDEPRCPRGDWLAQQFRILKEVANLRLYTGGRERELTPEERAWVTDALGTHRDRTFDQLRKLLNLDERARFNLERGGRKRLQGNTVEAALIGAFTLKQWKTMDEMERQAIRVAVTTTEDPEALAGFLSRYELQQKKLDALLDLDIPDGHVRFSRKALLKLLPQLEAGLNEYDAVQAVYGDRDSEAAQDALPPVPDEITNPLVYRALVETRKVVNAILREYGRPSRIVVELAREMKGSRDERLEYSRQIREREDERKAVKEILQKEFRIAQPSRQDIDRYRLWKEQGEVCPYTGKTIPQSAVFDEQTTDVDHILPRWRSLDNSFANKVLCYTDANREKGNRTPYEWLRDTPAYDAMMQRVERMRLGFGTLRRFQMREIDEDDVQSRQLNDTRYISREVSKYLNLLFPAELRVGEKAVGSTTGQLTAELRWRFGLESILGEHAWSGTGTGKNRNDHRHHAVDAIVVALSTRKRFKQYSDSLKGPAQEATDSPADTDGFGPPWATFREDAQAAVNAINVSHRALRKIRDALHQETFYGRGHEPGSYVTRKRIEALSGKDVQHIRDRVIRALVEERLRAFGWEGGTELPKGALNDPGNPLRMKSGVVINRVRLQEALARPHPFRQRDGEEPFRYAVLGNNHHAEFIERTLADGSTRVEAVVVSMMEAARRVRIGKEPIVRRDHGPGARFLMSLSQGESVLAVDLETGEEVLCVVQKMSETKTFVDIYLRDARDARPATEASSNPFTRITSAKRWLDYRPAKVLVDPLGRVGPAGD